VAGVVVLIKQVFPEELVALAVEATEALVLERVQTLLLTWVAGAVVVGRKITAEEEMVVLVS
jgi:hypothetical protein